MIPARRLQERLINLVAPLGAELVSLNEALGRVLAEDVIARRTQPPWAVSAMDGYAVHAKDVAGVPARLKVIGAVPAGQAYSHAVKAGEAVRIFTGAPLPAGTDAIVIQEDTDRDGDIVIVREEREGRYVRAGLDYEGEIGLKPAAGSLSRMSVLRRR